MKQILVVLAVLLLASLALAQEAPPAPLGHVVDEAKVLSPGAVTALNVLLMGAENNSSNHIVVAVYPAMGVESGDIAARGRDLFTAWGVGRDGGNMGVLLLVYIADHKINITVSDGLRGKLPNATCQTIIDHDIAPRFKEGDFDRGIDAGVSAILAALNGSGYQPPPPYFARQSVVGQFMESQSLDGWLIGLGIAFVIFCYVIEGIYEQQYVDNTAPVWATFFICIAKCITFILSLLPSRRSCFFSSSGYSHSSWGGSGGGFFGGSGGGSWGGGGCSSGGGASGSW